MAGYPSGMYGTGRNWKKIAFVSVAGILVIVVLFGAYNFCVTVMSAEYSRLQHDRAVRAQRSVSDANEQVAFLIKQAMSSLSNRPMKIIEARDRLNEILPMAMGVQQRQYIKNELSKLSDEWLFSSRVLPGDKLCGYYKIESGDLLAKIGSRYKVPYEILMEINEIT